MAYEADNAPEPFAGKLTEKCAAGDLRIYRLDEATYDAAKMAALIQRSRKEGFDKVALMAGKWQSGFSKPGEGLYCAEKDGVIVGICGRAVDPLNPGVLQLREGYVLPEWRQLGVGKALLRYFLDDIPAGLFDKITVRAYFAPARSFAKLAGFHSVEQPRCTHEKDLRGAGA